MMMLANLYALARDPGRARRLQSPIRRRTSLSHLWDDRADRVVRNAFMHADDPGLVLDVSRSVGRFWPVIMEKPNRRLIAGGADIEKIVAARDAQPSAVAEHIYPLKTGFSRIDLPQGGVDCVACIGLWETGLDSTQRLALLGEFYRLTRESVIISACVDGNVASWNRGRRVTRRGQPQVAPWNLGSILDQETVEQEFEKAGLKVVGVFELLPLFSSWRVYVLRKAL